VLDAAAASPSTALPWRQLCIKASLLQVCSGHATMAGKQAAQRSAWLIVLLVAASQCVALAQNISDGVANTRGRKHWHDSRKCQKYLTRHGKYPHWCKPR
jgi:hypothetical protein